MILCDNFTYLIPMILYNIYIYYIISPFYIPSYITIIVIPQENADFSVQPGWDSSMIFTSDFQVSKFSIYDLGLRDMMLYV